MDVMSSETNEENDNIERPVRRRHSSILKPPRSPLRDLRDGNEIVQESNALRNKKNSRRVSFADTIKVFQTESHMKTVRKSEIAETEARENVLFMKNNNPEDNYCEIIGMNTLLCAPIQTQMQQREVSVTEHSREKKHSNDQTIIFSDENQMDLTASHTVMITKDLLDYTKNEKSTTIDTTAFLANLKLHTEDSRMKKELNFSMAQNTNSEKKINFNDFIKRLKTRKSNASCTGPDKENSEISIHSKESNRTSSIYQMHESLHIDETGSNVTRIFREQDDEMDFTHCHTANIQSLVPTSNETSLREFKSDEVTVYGSDLMDLTRNHTIQILPSADNLSEIENQTQTVMMDVTTGYRTKASEKKRVLENKPNAAFQDPSLNPKGEIHITRNNIIGTETHRVTQTSNQDISTLTMIPESVCSSPAIQDYKTFLYSSCNNAMELTECLSRTREGKNMLKYDSNYAKMYSNPDASSLLIEKTIYSGDDRMDITKRHTVAIDNQIFEQDQTDVQIAISISEKEIMLQNHVTVSKDKELNVNCSSVPDVSRERLKQGLANPWSVSLTSEKNVIFAGKDEDLTKSHKTNLGSQAPPASYNLASEDINKSHFDSNGLLNESEKITKSHSELSQQQNIISKNFLTDTWRREKNQVLDISPYLDKVSPQSVNINQDSAKYNILYSGGGLNKQVALGNNRNTVSCEQSLFPTTKLFSSEGQCTVENHNTSIDSHVVKSVPGQNSKLPEALRESLGNPLDCSHDKMIVCSEEEQNMDLTKSHTVVIGFGPSEVQELGKTNLKNSFRHEAVKVEKYNKTRIEKSGVFIFNDMDTLEDKCGRKPGFLNENQDVKICERKSIDRLKIDKTVIFSEGDENDMDITKSCTLEINHRPLLDEPDSHFVPLAGTSKTVLYACGQDDMEVTRSHTTAIECETISPDKVTTRPVDKTVMFIGNHDDLEMTKSHTVFIDCQSKERTVLPDRPDFELSKKKSLGKPTVTSNAEESVFFPENVKSDHSAAKVSQLTLGERSNSGPTEKAVAVIANGNMEVSTSTIWKNDKDVPKPRFLNEPLSDISQRRKSLRFKNDKSIALSSNDKNDMDIIQSCTVEINNKSALEDRENSLLEPLAGTSKTVFYTYGQDDMEVTRSHTTAIECETISPDKVATRPVDKTVVFIGNHDDLEMTKSHTVFIDCQSKERTVLPDRPDFELSKKKSLGKPTVTSNAEESVFFPENVKSDHSAAKVSQLTLGERSNSGPTEKAVAVIANGNMEVSTSTIWKNDKDVPKPRFLNEPLSDISQRRKSLRFKNDKSIALSSNDKNDMDIIQSCTVEINNKSALEDRENSLLEPLAGTSKTVFYTYGQDDMEVTRSHTTAIECETISPDKVATRPVDKTVVFIGNHDDLEMTKSHTVFIDCQSKERTVLPDRPDFELSKKKSLGKPTVTSNAEESVFFPENVKSDHSAAKVSQLTLGERSNSGPTEKAVAVIANGNMEVSTSTIWKNDKDVPKPRFLNEPLSDISQRRKSLRFKNDKSIALSSNDKNDMDIIQSCTVEINNKSALEDRENSLLEPLAGTSKTVFYTYGQDDMEVTRSHTTAIECETISPDKVATRPVDKTVVFIGNHDDLEMTKSHTVFIDCQSKERTVLPDRPDFELSKKKSLGKPTVTSNAEESVFFPENVKSDHSAAKVSQLTLGERSNSGPTEKAVAVIANGNMEVSTSTIWKNDKDVPKPRFLNEPLSDISQRRKSLRFKNDKSIALSSNDKNDMDIIQSCTVEINNKSALEDRENSLLEPLAGTSKTVFYTYGQDDMEVTRSHTTALECKIVSPVKITSKPMQNTVMFVDNHNDLEFTKSHNAFTDCQATKKILQECSNFGTAKGKTLGVSFLKDGNPVQEVTEKQTQAVENKIVLHTEQKHHVIAYSNTFSGDQGNREIVKFHSTAVDEKDRREVIDQAYTLEKAKLESCHLSSTARRNVDFTDSHAPDTCESSNNYSYLPNVISYFDNLEGNVMFLCDKDKKASNCSVQNDLAYANDLASEYYLKSEGLLLSAPSLLEKGKITETNTKGQSDCVITVLKDQDLIKEPQNLLANQTLVYGQDLRNVTKLDSQQVSLKFPEDQVEAFVHNAEHSLKQTFVDDVSIGSQPHLLTQLSLLPQQGQSVANKDESKTLNIVVRNSSVPTEELSKNKSIMLNNEKQYTVACEEPKKNIQTAKCNIAIDFHSDSDLTKQVVQTHANPKEKSDPIIASNTTSFSSSKPNMNNLNKKTEKNLDLQTVHIPPVPEQLLELVNNADNDMSGVQAAEISNMNTVSNNVKDDRDEENKFFHNGSETNSLPLVTFVKDKVRRCSLGIFLPRLPNKRNCSVTGIDDLEQVPSDITDLNHPETQLVSNKDLGIGFIAAKLNLSPSQYINEENLPMYPGEINSSDSISIETKEKSLIETYEKEVSPPENKMKETCNSQKRTWVQEDDDDIQNEKKIRKREIKCTDNAQDQEIFVHCVEGDIDKNANSVLIKSLSRTPSICSSSLESIKNDGTSMDCSTYRNSQMESQFLTDTICEESLKEKLKDGRITIKEFFILLQVHILIQKPRQSTLPGKFTINTQSTSEDLMLSQYVYRPKIQIYREDCEALRQKIEELKLSALNQDKLLSDVNRNLWEKMRHCCDEELKAFGIYLNKIKSHFTKMTKVFTHQGKVALYSKLVQSAQNEREKLQVRIDEMDNILKKIDSCFIDVKLEIKNLENEEKDNFVEEWDSEMRAAEKELEQLKTEEEELQRNLLELEVQKEQTLTQTGFVKKQINTTEELLDRLSLSEWDVIEWSDDQAVFTFLYDTIELIITFGEPGDGLPFLNNAYRRIVDLNFQSLLDEDKAPPSSLLVHKLVFQYIEEQESWKNKCTTQHQVSKMLQEISMVVSHCRLLGEEIEFLKRWGPNYNLMNIDVKDTELRLLFSSSATFAKFEITLSVSAHYPSVLLPFSIKNHIGNISHSEISALLFKVPLEDNYLKNAVKQIYQDLLQG